jgi:hypothetical protein
MKVARLVRQYSINRKARASTKGWDPRYSLPYSLIEEHTAEVLGPDKNVVQRHQGLIPKDPSLAKKLGIKKGARVNYFASFYGNFARALSEKTQLSATDASKEMKEFVQSRKHKIPFRTIPAQSYPRIRNAYDWSVSFEPFPLLHVGGLELAAMRGLLNRKGVKIISTSKNTFSIIKEKEFTPKLAKVAKLYGADLDERKVQINASARYGLKPKVEYVDVITLHTNNIAREKVHRDLMLISAIEKGKAKTEKELIKFGLKIGLNEVQVRASLKRISQLPLLL